MVETGESPGVSRSAATETSDPTPAGQTPSSTTVAAPKDTPSSASSSDASSEGAKASTESSGEAEDGSKAAGRKKSSKRARPRAGTQPNNVRKLRQEAMMSKAELARRAGVSPLTIDRVEAGCPCRMDTKRKILEALGLDPSARAKVWPDIDN